jgi:hypothetical protein
MIAARQGLILMTRCFALASGLLVLFVCSSSQPVQIAQARVLAGSGSDRPSTVKRTQATSEKPIPANQNAQARLAALRAHSREWWTVLSEIEAEENARLARVLVICKGCFDSIADDRSDQSNR